MSARGTLIYDGECSLCVAAATWLDRRLPSRDDVDVIDARQWLATTRGTSVLSRDEVARAAWWVEQDRRLEGSRALAQALITLGGGWRLVGRTLASRPVNGVAAPVYRFVARHRWAVHRRRRCRPSRDRGRDGSGRMRIG
ncbi:MAG: thiol-disulfide oxidoreductase DCC family protein [Acidimicrobiales bacterium]